MPEFKIAAYELLERVRNHQPVVHHLTNWVTIYDCAQVVKVLGGSPVMAHAKEEAAQMANLASALVLNIGTLTLDLVEAMKGAARRANIRGIPVILDACGVGATEFRNRKCFELLDEVRIDILKGNASEIARVSGESVKTKGVDAGAVDLDLKDMAQRLAQELGCTVAITGAEDIVADARRLFLIRNGHPIMSSVVGTGCMATSVIGAFAAVERDLALAAAGALVCYEVAAECAATGAPGPGTFKEKMFDCLYHLDRETLERGQRVEICEVSTS